MAMSKVTAAIFRFFASGGEEEEEEEEAMTSAEEEEEEAEARDRGGFPPPSPDSVDSSRLVIFTQSFFGTVTKLGACPLITVDIMIGDAF